MRLKANNIIITARLLTAFDLDTKEQIPTALVNAKLLPDGYPVARLQMCIWMT